MNVSLHCCGSHGSLNFRVHIDTHTINHHFAHLDFNDIQNTSTLTLGNLLCHFQRNLALFGRRNATLAFLSSLFFKGIDLFLVLANLSLLDILWKNLIVELVRVLKCILVVDLASFRLHHITFLGVCEVLEFVILALSEVLLEHLFVLNSSVLLVFETFCRRIVTRQVVVIVIIHDSKELFVWGSLEIAFSFVLLSHKLIKLILDVSGMLLNLTLSFPQLSSQLDLGSAVRMCSYCRTLKVLISSQINAAIGILELTGRCLDWFWRSHRLLLRFGSSLFGRWCLRTLLFGRSLLEDGLLLLDNSGVLVKDNTNIDIDTTYPLSNDCASQAFLSKEIVIKFRIINIRANLFPHLKTNIVFIVINYLQDKFWISHFFFTAIPSCLLLQ